MDSSLPNTPSVRKAAAFDFHGTKSYPNTPGGGASLLNKESYREAVAQIHSVIYNGKGKDREAVEEVIDRFYDHSAMFETPLTVSIGKRRIADQFALMALLPSHVYSELQDVCESQDFNGNRSVLLTHTLSINLNPFSDIAHPAHTGLQARSSSHPGIDWYFRSAHYDGWTSYAPTPAAANTPGLYQSPTNDHSDDLPLPQLRGADVVYEPSSSHTPVQKLRWWSPFSILSSPTSKTLINKVTNLQLKILTRLDFNEFDRIVHHEDSYSVKDLLEGIPLLRPIYYLNRRILAYSISRASGIVLSITGTKHQEHSLLHSSRRTDEEHTSELPHSLGPSAAISTSAHGSDIHLTAPLSSGLQLDLQTLMRHDQSPTTSRTATHGSNVLYPYKAPAVAPQVSYEVPTSVDPDHL